MLEVDDLKKFNKLYILKEIIEKYCEIFPNTKGLNAVVSSYGYRDGNGKDFFNLFVCISKNNNILGFAVYYTSKRILRFYNHEGEDMGIETDMQYEPIRKGKIMSSVKLKKNSYII